MVRSQLCIDSWMGSGVSLSSCLGSWFVVEPGWRPGPPSRLPSLCVLSRQAPVSRGVVLGWPPLQRDCFLLLLSAHISRSWALAPTLRFCCPRSLYWCPNWVSASLPSSLVQHLKCFANSHWFILLPETGAWDLPLIRGAWPRRAVNRRGALLSGEGL